ncbi:MAG: hypothetical protein Q8R64_08840 [Sulfurimicrobium sp.]|nr:hypothetical protein [Sulfurimicrobium sp.]
MSAIDELWAITSVGIVVGVSLILAIYSWIGWRAGRIPQNKNIPIIAVAALFAVISYVFGVIAIVVRAEMGSGVTINEFIGSMSGLFIATMIYFPLGLFLAYSFKRLSKGKSDIRI